VLITSRHANWSGAIDVLPVDLLAPAAAVEFLMERTGSRRRKELDAADDLAAADKLAEELGYLALALEQAAAYIATRRVGFMQYLAEWGSRRDKVLDWFDACLMPYPKSAAITWLTTFDELSPAARRLLQRLAWLAPAPIPETLLEVPVPELDPFDLDALDALIELESYALVTRFATPDFGVHPLVQEVTRNIQRDDRGHTVLKEALNWVNGAFVGDPQDVQSWPVLEPLAAHARAVAGYADAADIPDPTARLLAQAGALLLTKSQPIEAEPLIHRALVIDEARYGADHPIVATGLNNLATLLQSTNRLSEAEPLVRRALAIYEARYCANHPMVATGLNNLVLLLQGTNRLGEAESTMRRALMICIESLGMDHPDTKMAEKNYADILKGLGRSEAEIAEALCCHRA
jgi:tetratricopeptide (TPR) repeat protein